MKVSIYPLILSFFLTFFLCMNGIAEPGEMRIDNPSDKFASSPASVGLSVANANLERVRAIRKEIASLGSWEEAEANRIARERGADFSPKGKFEKTAEYEDRVKKADSILTVAKQEASDFRKAKEKDLKSSLSSLESKEFVNVPAKGRSMGYEADKELLKVSAGVEGLEGEFTFSLIIPPEDAQRVVRGWNSVSPTCGVGVAGNALALTSLKVSLGESSWSSRRMAWDGTSWVEEVDSYIKASAADTGTDVSVAIAAWEAYLNGFPRGRFVSEAQGKLGVWRDRQARRLVPDGNGWVTSAERERKKKKEEAEAQRAAKEKAEAEAVEKEYNRREMCSTARYYVKTNNIHDGMRFKNAMLRYFQHDAMTYSRIAETYRGNSANYIVKTYCGR